MASAPCCTRRGRSRIPCSGRLRTLFPPRARRDSTPWCRRRRTESMLTMRPPNAAFESSVNGGDVLTMWSATLRQPETSPSSCHVVVHARDSRKPLITATGRNVGCRWPAYRCGASTRRDAAVRRGPGRGVVQHVAGAHHPVDVVRREPHLIVGLAGLVGDSERALDRVERPEDHRHHDAEQHGGDDQFDERHPALVRRRRTGSRSEPFTTQGVLPGRSSGSSVPKFTAMSRDATI